MESKKSPKADLENKRWSMGLVGLVISLAIVGVAFEWKQFEAAVADLGGLNLEDEEEELIPITQQEVAPPPPPPPAPVQIEIVEDDEEIEDVEIEETEIDEDTEIEVIEEEEEEVVEEEIFSIVEEMPSFPGGETQLFKFLGKNIKYPAMARDAGIKGRVYIQFVVWKDGSIRDVQLLRGIGGGCDEEAMRVVKMMPNWNAGRQRGKAVSVIYRLPVNFQLH